VRLRLSKFFEESQEIRDLKTELKQFPLDLKGEME